MKRVPVHGRFPLLPLIVKIFVVIVASSTTQYLVLIQEALNIYCCGLKSRNLSDHNFLFCRLTSGKGLTASSVLFILSFSAGVHFHELQLEHVNLYILDKMFSHDFPQMYMGTLASSALILYFTEY